MTINKEELNSDEFSEISKSNDIKIEGERKKQRARHTINGGRYGISRINIYDLTESVLKLLVEHEEFIMEEYKKSFNFKLPTPKDLKNINENGTLEYKRGWKAGAQYMINLNK
jgi:hypothetical protein